MARITKGNAKEMAAKGNAARWGKGKKRGSSSGDRRKSFETAAWWVSRAPADKEMRTRMVSRKVDGAIQQVEEEYEVEVPPKCPSELHRLLFQMKLADPSDYVKSVMLRILPGPPKVKEEATPPTEREIIGDTLEMLRAQLTEEVEAKLSEVWS